MLENFSSTQASPVANNADTNAKQLPRKKQRKCYVVATDQSLPTVYSNLNKVWTSLNLYDRKAFVITEGTNLVEKPLNSYSSFYRIAKRRSEIIIYAQRLQNPAVVIQIFQTLIQ